MGSKVIFNVLAKDLENAVAVSTPDRSRILVGVLTKDFATVDEAAQTVRSYASEGILVSVGLGAGDPAMWKRVADVSALTNPYHINQVYPAAGYTKGVMDAQGKTSVINSLIEPAEHAGKVYISTGAVSHNKKEPISCETAAKLLADIGLNSVKFYPVHGNKKLDHIKAMAEAAVNEGIEIFEPTGSIDLDNVREIVQICLDAGVRLVIPHLYSSLIDKATGLTNPEYIKRLLYMEW